MQVHSSDPYNIRVTKDIWRNDYSNNGPKLSDLAHEFGHTVSGSNGLSKKNDNNYKTQFVDGQSFGNYGVEQQGELMRGLYNNLNGVAPGTSMNAPNSINGLNNKVLSDDEYETIFGGSGIY